VSISIGLDLGTFFGIFESWELVNIIATLLIQPSIHSTKTKKVRIATSVQNALTKLVLSMDATTRACQPETQNVPIKAKEHQKT